MACTKAAYPQSSNVHTLAEAVGAKQGQVMEGAKTQNWANLVRVLGKLAVREERLLAAGAAFVAGNSDRIPQGISNTLLGLAAVGWEEKAMVGKLAHAMKERAGSSNAPKYQQCLVGAGDTGLGR